MNDVYDKIFRRRTVTMVFLGIRKKNKPLYTQYLYYSDDDKISLASPCIWTNNRWEILGPHGKIHRFDTRKEAEKKVAELLGVEIDKIKAAEQEGEIE